MFSMMVATFTQGIDMTKPIGVLVPLVDGMPQPVGVIPTSDAKGVLKRLEAQTGPADELDDGTLVIAIGANTIYIKQQGDWAVVAADREHLKAAPLDPTPLFEGIGPINTSSPLASSHSWFRKKCGHVDRLDVG